MRPHPVSALAALAVLAACSAPPRPGAAPPPAAEPQAVVEAFLAAANDSNLVRMATLWGTAAGSAYETRQPADFERRILVMQAYLRRLRSRVVATDGVGDRRAVQVELRGDACTRVLPFTTVRSARSGWLVNSFDLSRVPAAGGACDDGTGGADTTRTR